MDKLYRFLRRSLKMNNLCRDWNMRANYTIPMFIILVLIFTSLIRWFLPEEEKCVTNNKIKAVKKESKKSFPQRNLKIIAVFEEPAKKNASKRSHPARKLHVQQKPIAGNKVIKVEKKYLTVGMRVLKRERNSLPLLEFDFAEIGAIAYFELVRELGGRFFIVEGKKALYEAVITTNKGRIVFDGFKRDFNLVGLSPISHEIVDEPFADEIIRKAVMKSGKRGLRFVALLPVDREGALLGVIQSVVESAGYGLMDFSKFSGRYTSTETLLIDSGIKKKDGTTVALNITLDIRRMKKW